MARTRNCCDRPFSPRRTYILKVKNVMVWFGKLTLMVGGRFFKNCNQLIISGCSSHYSLGAVYRTRELPKVKIEVSQWIPLLINLRNWCNLPEVCSNFRAVLRKNNLARTTKSMIKRIVCKIRFQSFH